MWPELLYENFDFTDEVKNLTSINERFNNEPEEVKRTRVDYAEIFRILTRLRDNTWRTEAWRNFAIAITELENSCIRAIKWLYLLLDNNWKI